MAESINFKNEVYWDSSSISHNKKKLSDILFPVNSIYLSVSSTNPTNYFGGTWVQIAQGRTLVGVDTSDSDFNVVEKTGGEKAHNHLTSIGVDNNGVLYNYVDNTNNPKFGSAVIGNVKRAIINTVTYQENEPVRIAYTEEKSSMPPYFTCYIWLRTA